jgi:hypothetical protein
LEQQIILNDLDILNLEYKTSNIQIIDSQKHKFLNNIEIESNLTTDSLNVTNDIVTNNLTANNTITFTNTLNTVSATTFSYISGLTSDAQLQIDNNDLDILNLKYKTSNIEISDSDNHKFLNNIQIESNLTTNNLIANNDITFDGNLNNISSNVVNYIANLTSDVQSQIDTAVANLDSTSNLLQQDINFNETNASNYIEVTSNYLQTLFSDNIKLIDHDVTMTSNLFVIGNITANSIDVIDTDSDVPYNTSLISYIETKINEAIQPLLTRIAQLESEHGIV